MSETTNNLPATATEEIAKKRQQWGNLGELIYRKDFELQARSQAIIAKLPTDFKDIPSAEVVIAEVNKELAALQEERMKITNPVKDRMTALMVPEKNLETAIQTAKVGLLAAKTEAAKIAAAALAKSDELKRAREAMANYIVQKDGAHRVKITDAVLTVFKKALEAKIPEDQIGEWLDKEKHKPFMLVDFAIPKPNMKPNLNSQDEIDAVWLQLAASITPDTDYMASFHSSLSEKFGFYGISLKNAEAVIEMETTDAALVKSTIAEDVSAQETANKLNALAVSVTPTVTVEGKALKQTYELAMEDTEQNAIIIIAAFIANLAICRGGLRVSVGRKLTVSQMEAALIWAKNKDAQFQPQGIVFKSKTKL